MANTLELGNGKWATSKDTVLAFNDENNNFKPLPFSFSRDSSATVVNKDGLIETVGVGEPRIDFKDNTKGALLLEPERTNLLPYSEDYSQSVFTRRNCTINQNYAISPSGLLDATLVSANGSDAAIFDNIGVTSGNTYTLSVYLRVESGTLDTTLSLGSAGFPNTSGDGGRVKDITITTEWKRFTLTSTADANAGSDIGIIGGFGGFNNGDSVLIYAAQLEQGSYATSYIPTSGQANGVTRIADVCNNGGNDQVINSTEGVFYVEIEGFENDNVNRYISLCDSSSSNAIRIFYYRDGGTVFFRKNVNTVGVITSSTTVINQSELAKIAIRYNSTSFDIFSNGVKILTNSNSDTFSNNTLNTINFTDSNGFSSPFLGNVKDLKVYNTALTDQELQALTTI
jgi:hypothetical protein